ncbi:hypothetical protein MMC26_006698 [Xylographa opegraphella]|nr:hypothetical protein [Xylographa opegraphella]
MSTAVWPYLPPDELIKEEKATQARELEWLLNSLQETLASLKSGLEECIALLAPKEPGSTLVISSMRSESVKGFVTRVGTRIVKGDIHIRLPTLPPLRSASSYPLHLSTLPTAPSLVLTQLTSVRNLINQSLDVVDISTWTGDAHDANFIAGQLRLLFDLIQEAREALKGGDEIVGKWWEGSVDENLRTLQLTNPNTPTSFTSDTLPGLSLRQRLGLAARLPEHDESGQVFTFRGQEVRVREKVRVESQDPSLMSVMAKLSALEHGVGVARRSLAIVMGVEEEDG